MLTIWPFDNKENKHSLYREDCMKKFSKPLREHTKNMIDFQKKKNVTTNKKGTTIISRCDRMSHLQKKTDKKGLQKIKTEMSMSFGILARK